MNSQIAFHLWREQERLEQLGWQFLVRWSAALGEWVLDARQDDGPMKVFWASTRQELMQAGLGWAATAGTERDTLPAPAMTEAAE